MSPISPADQTTALEETTHEAMTEAMVAPAGKRIVEIGCGDGALARHLASADAAVIGIDPAREKIDAARVAANETANAAEFLTGVGETLAFGDAVLDVVIYSNSLHHVAVEKCMPPWPRRPGCCGRAAFSTSWSRSPRGPSSRSRSSGTTRPSFAPAPTRKWRAPAISASRRSRSAFCGAARRFDDFEDISERMAGRNPANRAAFADKAEAIRERFEDLARPEDGTRVLDMGFRVNLLRKRAG
jgi:SAM-dependent methyltransferase